MSAITRISVKIDSLKSLKTNFINIYCYFEPSSRKYELLERYRNGNTCFVFEMRNLGAGKDERNLGNALCAFADRYGSAVCIEFEFYIQNDADYSMFFSNFTVFDAKPDEMGGDSAPAIRIKLRKAFQGCCIRFITEYSEKEKVNPLLLHNFLLFLSHCASPFPKIRFFVRKTYPDPDPDNQKEKDLFRYSVYLQNCNREIINCISLNKNCIRGDSQMVGKVIPALQLNPSFLDLMRAPIKIDQWKSIISSKKIERDTFQDSESKKYWFLYQACQKYLTAEFEDNKSMAYTELRRRLFSTPNFYREHIAAMPFLSVLLFAQYDYYWRDRVFDDYKAKLKERNASIPLQDLLLSLQTYQNVDHFMAYREQITCDNYADVKSLVVGLDQHELQRIVNKRNPDSEHYGKIEVTVSKEHFRDIYDFSIYNQYDENICAKKSEDLSEDDLKEIQAIREIVSQELFRPHKIVIQEIFEAQTISEGVLQMIENAVYHSGNGLLSMRIRDYNADGKKAGESDTLYLKNYYPEYFGQKKDSQFYLEIKLSDLNPQTLTEKFLENAKQNPSVTNWHGKYADKICPRAPSPNREKIIFQPFFQPKDIDDGRGGIIPLNAIMQEYYKIPGNSIHHFGLQIFASIVSSKKGLFSVSGHGAYYANSPDVSKKHLNTEIRGASYDILIPFVSSLYVGGNVVDSVESIQLYYGEENSPPTTVIDWDTLKISEFLSNYQTAENKTPKSKEKCIHLIAESIDAYTDAKCLVFDFSRQNAPKGADLELFMKGLLTGLLNNSHPVAIIGLDSHHFLEAIRLVSLLYNKNGESATSLDDLQIYLCGQEIGEEMLFFGSQMSDNAGRLQRAAMTQGMMSEYWEIANSLLKR